MIYFAADHRGFGLKNILKKWLQEEGYKIEDVGAAELDVSDDYPDFAITAIKKMTQDLDQNKAILICGSGHGMDIAANKFKGIRAALCFNNVVAKQAREHEDANVLVLASDWLKENAAKEIVKTFLETPFSAKERHMRRIKKINNLET